MARTVKTVEDRREQIMEAALKVFAKKGFSAASNKDIAREARITSGLIYHYFDSKEALLKAIVEERSPQRIIHSIPPGTLELLPEKFLGFMVKQLLSGVEDERFMALLRVYLPEAIYHPESVSIVNNIIAEASAFIGGYLRSRMQSGELRAADPDLITNVVMGSVMDIALRRQVFHDPLLLKYSQDQIVESVVTLAMQGLVPV